MATDKVVKLSAKEKEYAMSRIRNEFYKVREAVQKKIFKDIKRPTGLERFDVIAEGLKAGKISFVDTTKAAEVISKAKFDIENYLVGLDKYRAEVTAKVEKEAKKYKEEVKAADQKYNAVVAKIQDEQQKMYDQIMLGAGGVAISEMIAKITKMKFD